MRAIYYIGLITLSATSVGFAKTAQPQANGFQPKTDAVLNGQKGNGGLSAFERSLNAQRGLERQIGQIDEAIAKVSEPLPRLMRSKQDASALVVGFPEFYLNKFVPEHVLVAPANKAPVTLTGSGAAPTVAPGTSGTAPTAPAAVTLAHPDDQLKLAVGNMARMNPEQKKPPVVAGGEGAEPTSAAAVAEIQNMMGGFKSAASQITVPGGFENFPGDTDGGYEMPAVCAGWTRLGECFNGFLDGMSTAAAERFKLGRTGGAPSGTTRASLRLPKLYRALFIGFDWLTEFAIAGAEEIAGFFKGRIRGTGYQILTAKTAQNRQLAGQPDGGLGDALSRFNVATLDQDGHQSALANIVSGPAFTEGGSYYRAAAKDLVELGPKAGTVIDDGIKEFNRVRNLETSAAADIKKIQDQVAGLEAQKKKLQDELNDPNSAANNPQADAGAGQGGGGSGGGAGGGGGGGQGLQPGKAGENLKFEAAKFGSVPEGGSIAGGLGGLAPTDSRGFTDRGALPTGQFKMPEIQSSRGPNRTQPFSYASGAKNNNGPAQRGNGSTGSPIGNQGGGQPGDQANAGGGGGNPPVAGGAGGGGGGFGNVPNVGGGEEGGADRGLTSSFVRTTDYGGGGGEGGAGPGPDNGGDPGSLGAKIASATGGSVGGVGFAAKEIKENPRAKGMGLMAYVGGFRDFCGEKRALGVGACGASSRGETGRAFRAPASDPVGGLVAQRINANAAPARAFTTISK